MKELYIRHIAGLLGIKDWQVENCVEMFAQGDTIPFISRYRKEKTGGLDDASVAELKHLCDVFGEMEKRKQTILAAVSQAGALDDALRERIENCLSSAELEDLYLPYKPKRRTRGQIAIEAGLEPLADLLWSDPSHTPEVAAAQYVDADKGVAADLPVHGLVPVIVVGLSFFGIGCPKLSEKKQEN